MDKKIIAIIPARGGSKGIPRKNIKDLCGKPLISYIIQTALRVKKLDRVIVSTEDEEIAEVAKKYGAEVPFLRPRELAEDDVATLPVLQHAIEYLKKSEGYVPDYVFLLYPTSPLLKSFRVEEAIDICLAKNADSVISGHYDKGHFWVEKGSVWERLYPVDIKNRQRSKPLFRENGAIYLIRTAILAGQIVADRTEILIMEKGENIDVDTPEDFEQVKNILQNK